MTGSGTSGERRSVGAFVLAALRAMPWLGAHLLLPALVIGAVGGSAFDLLLGHERYVLASAGVVLGPVAFALAVNALERADAAHEQDMAALAERYREEQDDLRRAAAQARGELVRFEDYRARRR
ncbi:MAG: hypothetical protein WBA67_10200 [Jannaschia sp.]